MNTFVFLVGVGLVFAGLWIRVHAREQATKASRRFERLREHIPILHFLGGGYFWRKGQRPRLLVRLTSIFFIADGLLVMWWALTTRL
jgi:hypothetical protein